MLILTNYIAEHKHADSLMLNLTDYVAEHKHADYLMLTLTDCVAGRARIIVMLHPEDEEGAAQRKVAAMTGIEALGGGAKVSHFLRHPCNICKFRIGKWLS